MGAACAASALVVSNSAGLSVYPSSCTAARGGSTLEGYARRKISRSFSWVSFFIGKDSLSLNFLPSIPGSLFPNLETGEGTRSGWCWWPARRLGSHASYSAFLLRSRGPPATLWKRSQKANARMGCGAQRALVEDTEALMSNFPRQLPTVALRLVVCAKPVWFF